MSPAASMMVTQAEQIQPVDLSFGLGECSSNAGHCGVDVVLSESQQSQTRLGRRALARSAIGLLSFRVPEQPVHLTELVEGMAGDELSIAAV